MTTKSQFLLYLSFLFFLSACSGSLSSSEDYKALFQDRILPTENFTIDSKTNQVLESNKGSVLSIPKGAFLDENGEIWEGETSLSLVEIQDPSELLEARLSSASKEGVLAHKAVVQLTASTKDGKKLTINPERAPYIELAVDGEGKDLKVYTGEEDEHGAIKWTTPEAAPKFLIPQDLALLDFYPAGFEQMVESNMPYKGYKVATRALKDSLYYSLHSFVSGVVVTARKRTDPDYYKGDIISTSDTIINSDNSSWKCSGIDPAIIQTIKHPKFANTFIATREFATRLKVLFNTCDDENLQLYITHLDKNLWEVDEFVANRLGEKHDQYNTFKSFAAEKLTTVKGGELHAKALRNFYTKKLKANQKALEKAKEAYHRANRKKDKEAIKKRKQYKTLLRKRMTYRLKKHGIVFKKDSPYTLCEVLSRLEPFELEITVPNKKEFDRVQVYVVDPVENCLFAMLPNSSGVYDHGYEDDWALVLWKKQQVHIVAFAYRGDSVFTATEQFQLAKRNIKSLTPTLSSEKEYKKLIANFDRNRKHFNKIKVDLAYQRYFEKDRKRQEKLIEEQNFMRTLAIKAFPCCFTEAIAEGAKLFKANCVSCHAIHEKVVGPAMKDILKRRSMAWAIEFTKYPERFITSGIDLEAMKLYEEYKSTGYMPNYDHLTALQITNILYYIESESDKKP